MSPAAELLGALAAVAAYAVAATLDMGWVGYAPALVVAAALLAVAWLRDRSEEREEYPEGVTYAGFGDMPEVRPDEVFDPWLEVPTLRRPLTPEYRPTLRMPDLPPLRSDVSWPVAERLPVEAEALEAVAALDCDDLLARWDAELDETRRRWDEEMGAMSCF